VHQAGHQDENVPRAVEHSWSIHHVHEMVVKPIHVLAGKKKNNEHDQPKHEMESFHGLR
jgi:hypothetical protein